MPTKKVIIHAIQEFSESEFFGNVVRNTMAASANPQHLRFLWAKGVIINVQSYPDTPDIIKEKMQGIQHYARVEYVRMDEYKQEVTVRIQNIPYSLTIVKSNDPLIEEVAEYVREKRYLDSDANKTEVATTA